MLFTSSDACSNPILGEKNRRWYLPTLCLLFISRWSLRFFVGVSYFCFSDAGNHCTSRSCCFAYFNHCNNFTRIGRPTVSLGRSFLHKNNHALRCEMCTENCVFFLFWEYCFETLTMPLGQRLDCRTCRLLARSDFSRIMSPLPLLHLSEWSGRSDTPLQKGR